MSEIDFSFRAVIRNIDEVNIVLAYQQWILQSLNFAPTCKHIVSVCSVVVWDLKLSLLLTDMYSWLKINYVFWNTES